jgi:hypothetical protein
MGVHMRIRHITLAMILLFVNFTYASAGFILISRSQLPITLNIMPGDLDQIQFTDATLLVQGQSVFYSDPEMTQVEGLLRFVNVGGLGQIDFATDPSTFPSLPPLTNPDFSFNLFLAPDQRFSGAGPVIIHDMPEVTSTYECITRQCKGLVSPDFPVGTLFQLTILEVPEPPTLQLLLSGGFTLGAVGCGQKYRKRLRSRRFALLDDDV